MAFKSGLQPTTPILRRQDCLYHNGQLLLRPLPKYKPLKDPFQQLPGMQANVPSLASPARAKKRHGQGTRGRERGREKEIDAAIRYLDGLPVPRALSPPPPEQETGKIKRPRPSPAPVPSSTHALTPAPVAITLAAPSPPGAQNLDSDPSLPPSFSPHTVPFSFGTQRLGGQESCTCLDGESSANSTGSSSQGSNPAGSAALNPNPNPNPNSGMRVQRMATTYIGPNPNPYRYPYPYPYPNPTPYPNPYPNPANGNDPYPYPYPDPDPHTLTTAEARAILSDLFILPPEAYRAQVMHTHAHVHIPSSGGSGGASGGDEGGGSSSSSSTAGYPVVAAALQRELENSIGHRAVLSLYPPAHYERLLVGGPKGVLGLGACGGRGEG